MGERVGPVVKLGGRRGLKGKRQTMPVMRILAPHQRGGDGQVKSREGKIGQRGLDNAGLVEANARTSGDSMS